MGACIVEFGRWATALISVSMSSARGVMVKVGIDVEEGQGVVVEEGQGVGAKVGREGEVCPEVVWGCALLNLA